MNATNRYANSSFHYQVGDDRYKPSRNYHPSQSRGPEHVGGYTSTISVPTVADTAPMRQLTHSYVNPAFHENEQALYPAPQPTDNMSEDQYRKWLETTFKPMFDATSETQKKGIPNSQMLRTFQFHDFNLDPTRLRTFLLKMDDNQDGYVTWKEFQKAMTRKRLCDLGLSNRIMLHAILCANPAIKGRERKRLQDITDTQALAKEKEYIPESYLEAYNCVPPPVFIPAICLAQIIFFIVYAVQINDRAAKEPWNSLTWTSGLPYWSPLIFDPRYRVQAWRYLSYMFIHQGIHHILFNVIVELLLGIPLETVHKFWRVGPVFIAGVVAGSLASGVVDRYVNLVGSSGGCYALIGAHYAIVIMNWEELQDDWLNFRRNPFRFLMSGVVLLIVLTLIIGLDFGIALYQRYGLAQKTQTSFTAHIGGLIAGLLVGIPVLKNLERKKWEMVIFWIAIVLFLCLMIFGIFWNVFYPDYPSPPFP